jgi:flap endonuclease-1
VLEKLQLDHEQLVAMALLIGTDYNPKGIPGIGPQKALKMVKVEKDLDVMFLNVKWGEYFSFPWREAFDTILEMPVLKDYTLTWKTPDVARVREILVEEHDFEAKRVDDRLRKCVEEMETQKQTGLGRWG